jgi:Suppressor of fused protein (SUFU)
VYSESAPRILGMPAHLERFLGRIVGGVHQDEHGDPLPYGLVHLRNRRHPVPITVATLGLGRHVLTMETSGCGVRQELVIPARSKMRQVAMSWLGTLADYALDNHRAFLKGETSHQLGLPQHPLVDGGRLTGFYFTSPGFWPERLAAHHDDEAGTVIIVLALPISDSEHHFVATHGHEAFEDLLADAAIDTTSHSRPDLHGVH